MKHNFFCPQTISASKNKSPCGQLGDGVGNVQPLSTQALPGIWRPVHEGPEISIQAALVDPPTSRALSHPGGSWIKSGPAKRNFHTIAHSHPG